MASRTGFQQCSATRQLRLPLGLHGCAGCPVLTGCAPAISKMGERTIRRLLILGTSAVVRWASQRGATAGSWLARMLSRKPRMLVAVALANKTARVVWALLVKGGSYKAPAVAA